MTGGDLAVAGLVLAVLLVECGAMAAAVLWGAR